MLGSESAKYHTEVAVSVVICTYNRAANLESCFECLFQQEGVSGLNWDIVLVDNNSTDCTAQEVERLSKHSPVPLRYFFESQQGLSFARNRGISEAKSEIIIFIDDDIHVTKFWLSSIYGTFASHNCDAVGGPIHLNLDHPLPSWIQPEMQGFLGFRDFGEQEFEMDGRTEFPFGGNMAFRKDTLLRCGHFNTNMGRVGAGKTRKELFKGEETDIFHRLALQGGSIFYQPHALVLHNILPHQLKKKFFRILHFNAGYQRAYVGELEFKRSIGGVPFYLLIKLVRSVAKYIALVISKGPSHAFRQQMNVGYFLGMILGCWQKASASKRVARESNS